MLNNDGICAENDGLCTKYGKIISELSPKFLQGYVAKDLGCPILTQKYFFGAIQIEPHL